MDTKLSSKYTRPLTAQDAEENYEAIERASAVVEVIRTRKFFYRIAHVKADIPWSCLSIDATGSISVPLKRYWTWQQLRSKLCEKICRKFDKRDLILAVPWPLKGTRKGGWIHIAMRECLFLDDLVWPGSQLVIVRVPGEMQTVIYQNRDLRVLQDEITHKPNLQQFDKDGETCWGPHEFAQWERDVAMSVERANATILRCSNLN